MVLMRLTPVQALNNKAGEIQSATICIRAFAIRELVPFTCYHGAAG